MNIAELILFSRSMRILGLVIFLSIFLCWYLIFGAPGELVNERRLAGKIIEQITRGITKKNFEIEEDRFLAIQKALRMAGENDFVLVAGKGHELYQIIKDRVLPFDDRIAVQKIIQEMEKNV